VILSLILGPFKGILACEDDPRRLIDHSGCFGVVKAESFDSLTAK
jgi:hypothetical protein